MKQLLRCILTAVLVFSVVLFTTVITLGFGLLAVNTLFKTTTVFEKLVSLFFAGNVLMFFNSMYTQLNQTLMKAIWRKK